MNPRITTKRAQRSTSTRPEIYWVYLDGVQIGRVECYPRHPLAAWHGYNTAGDRIGGHGGGIDGGFDRAVEDVALAAMDGGAR